MGKMECGYGSDWHLLRFLGYHRGLLDQRILKAVGGDSIAWFDFGFSKSEFWLDAQVKGLRFLNSGDPALTAWKQWWPQSGNSHNWDAVGQVRFGDVKEWLLVEAKAHLGELRADCKAVSPHSKYIIQSAFAETKQALGVPKDRDWMHEYYQFCNRVAALHFLNEHNVPSRLLWVYFVGDQGDGVRVCPADREGWQESLRAQDEHVGLPKGHRLENRIHKLFLPIAL
jgi:hypothetical protein